MRRPWRRLARFRQVAKWALLAYLFTAAMIKYAILRDHLGGGALIILTLSLAVYALQVPTLIAVTVARLDTPEVDDPRGCQSEARIGRQAPVAQLDRASVYGTEGREFESLRARCETPAQQGFFVAFRVAASRMCPGSVPGSV